MIGCACGARRPTSSTATSRAYSRALAELRDRHPEEFADLLLDHKEATLLEMQEDWDEWHQEHCGEFHRKYVHRR